MSVPWTGLPAGVGFHTSTDVHHGRAELVREHRARVLDAAHATHPERFVRKAPNRRRCPRWRGPNPPEIRSALNLLTGILRVLSPCQSDPPV